MGPIDHKDNWQSVYPIDLVKSCIAYTSKEHRLSSYFLPKVGYLNIMATNTLQANN